MAADDIMAFMTRVKRKLVDDDAQYATFVRALHRWEQQAIGTDELEASVTSLLADDEGLLRDFARLFAPRAPGGAARAAAAPADVDAAVAYLRDVEARIGDEARYGEFLALLRLWEAGRVEIDALVRDVSRLLGGDARLLARFNMFAPPGHAVFPEAAAAPPPAPPPSWAEAAGDVAIALTRREARRGTRARRARGLRVALGRSSLGAPPTRAGPRAGEAALLERVLMAESAATRPLEAARGPVAAAVFGAESPATRAYRGRVGARYAGSPVAARMPTLSTRLRRARTRTVSTRGLPPRFERSTSAVDSSRNRPNRRRRDREFRSSAGTGRTGGWHLPSRRFLPAPRLTGIRAGRSPPRSRTRRSPSTRSRPRRSGRSTRSSRGPRAARTSGSASSATRRAPARDTSDATSLQREGSARDRSGARIRASSARREIVARPGMSRNERTPAERGARDVGNVALVSRPGGRVRARGAPARVRARRAGGRPPARAPRPAHARRGPAHRGPRVRRRLRRRAVHGARVRAQVRRPLRDARGAARARGDAPTRASRAPSGTGARASTALRGTRGGRLRRRRESRPRPAQARSTSATSSASTSTTSRSSSTPGRRPATRGSWP